jgi:hypothetical protein
VKRDIFWRRAVIVQMIVAQDYERRLANPHSVHRRRWFDFQPGHECRSEFSLSYDLAPDSDMCGCV